MKKEISIFFEETTLSELTSKDKSVLGAAETAAIKAYAPYSEFRVGAAALLSNGELLVSNNQENMAFPSGLCAERIVAMYANSLYPEAKIEVMAIFTLDDDPRDSPVAPCGACRQVLLEYERNQQLPIRVLMSGKFSDRVIEVDGIEPLLPLSFFSEKLSKK